MKSFRFESISLISHNEKKARKVEFHPLRNLIKGGNHTGKSSLVKSLFLTLGARPAGKLAHWDPETISAVVFSVDAEEYTALHHRGTRALFDSSGTLRVATDAHDKWSEEFAKVVGFNLTVVKKEDATGIPADPECFFLPFYIDQDGSWHDKWDTFPSTIRFKQPIQSIIEYFSGIRPPEYYSLKSKHIETTKLAEAGRKELAMLERARTRLEESLPSGSVSLTKEGFEDEIRRLTQEANQLNARQEDLRLRCIKEAEELSNIERQINLAYASLQEYAGDRKYLLDCTEDAQGLVCPTCGAEHQESFLQYLGYAEDARVLEELARSLKKDFEEARGELRKTRNELDSLNDSYQRISAILEKKHGDMKFEQVVESYGAQAAHKAFNIERDQISGELGKINAELEAIEARLKELEDKKRTKSIMNDFKNAYVAATEALEVPSSAERMRLTSRPNVSGSGGPRLLLAYYAAIWKICHRELCSISVPVVIDSPNQQDQDDFNLHLVLKFISENLPATMQLIVCVTKQPSDAHMDKVVVFDEKYSLLNAQSYERVDSEVTPLYRAMNAHLLKLSV